MSKTDFSCMGFFHFCCLIWAASNTPAGQVSALLGVVDGIVHISAAKLAPILRAAGGCCGSKEGSVEGSPR